MPPSAHSQLGLVQTQQQQPYATSKKVYFGDTPTENGKAYLREVLTTAHSIARGGSSLGINLEGNDPGNARTATATQVLQKDDRDTATFHYMLSTIKPGSQLHATCSAAPFTNGEEIYNYLDSGSVVYIRPSDSEAQKHINKVKQLTWKDLPADKQDKGLCLHLKALITGHNPLFHPNMNISNGDMITAWCEGLHPEAKLIALELKNDRVHATAKQCVFPTNYPAGHPQVGTPHPNAGNLSLDAMAMYVHRKFNEKLSADLFHLKAPPSINLASASTEQQQDAEEEVYASIDDAMRNGCHDFDEYIYYVMNKQPPTQLLRTCKRCGGINHMADKCATPEGSVSEYMLRNIRYPMGVRPWIFKGKGYGKGKGRGKGSRGRGGYAGRGNMVAWQFHHEDPEPPALPPPETTGEPAAPPSPVDANAEIWDDYDGWNEWDHQ